MLKQVENSPELVESYYDYVENELGKQTALQESELAMLSIIAKPGGSEELSQFFQVLGAGLVDKSKQDELQTYINNNPQYAELAKRLSPTSFNDGYGYTNGGLITSASVTPINDGTGSLVKTHPNDQFLAAKSGGPIDKLFDIVSNILNNDKSGNNKGVLNIELSGNINLQDGNNKVNLVELIKKDPVTAREFTRLIIKNMDSSNNGKVSQQYYI
jgi:hypothetical protein